MTRHEPEYFAVLDPADTSAMTYWRKLGTTIASWPPRAHHGPVLYKRDIPRGLHGKERFDFGRRWHETVRKPWEDAVHAAIEADWVAAAARFAALHTRCCFCGRELTDPASKTYGIGPDCRDGQPDEALAMMADLVRRAHAEIHVTA